MSVFTPLNKAYDGDNWAITIFISLKQTYNHFDTYLFIERLTSVKAQTFVVNQ